MHGRHTAVRRLSNIDECDASAKLSVSVWQFAELLRSAGYVTRKKQHDQVEMNDAYLIFALDCGSVLVVQWIRNMDR